MSTGANEFQRRIAVALILKFLSSLAGKERNTEERIQRAIRGMIREAVFRWPRTLRRAGFLTLSPLVNRSLAEDLCGARLTEWLSTNDPSPYLPSGPNGAPILGKALKMIGVQPTDDTIDEAQQILAASVEPGRTSMLAYRHLADGRMGFRVRELAELLRHHRDQLRRKERSLDTLTVRGKPWVNQIIAPEEGGVEEDKDTVLSIADAREIVERGKTRGLAVDPILEYRLPDCKDSLRVLGKRYGRSVEELRYADKWLEKEVKSLKKKRAL